MSFSTQEESRQLGEPVNIYLFRYGTGVNDVFCYADCEVPINFDGRTYIPTPIERDSITAKSTLDKTAIEIRMSQTTELADLFRYYPPSEVVTLTIFQGHNEDPLNQWIAAWSGRVLGFKIDGNTASYTCEPVASSMKRPGLRRHYQYGCPHALYGTQCGANKAAATITRTITAVFSNAVSLDNAWESAPRKEKYIGGLLEWAASGRTERRTILNIQDSDNTLVLSGPIRDLAIGGTVTLSLGCNHQMSDCSAIHNNIVNFGGQPYIPLKNPIGIRNNFY